MREDFELAARRNFHEIDLTRVGDGYLNTATQAKWVGFLMGICASEGKLREASKALRDVFADLTALRDQLERM
jgi:hypothetical protein